MAMLCPQCKISHDQRLHCPECNTRLVCQSGYSAQKAVSNDVAGRWTQTAVGRCLLGLLLAQGLYFGLRKLCTAGMLATENGDLHGLWSTSGGVLLLQGLQGIGLLIGCALAGAGHRRGTMLGLISGVANGAISLALALQAVHDTAPVLLYGQPLLHAAFGTLGGLIGCTIWKPISVAKSSRASKAIGANPILPVMTTSSHMFSGPIAWVRVLVGSTLVVVGLFYAKTMLNIVLQASEGKLSVDTYLQSELVTWEIKALVVLIGSALAGAGTVNGLKQGLCVGLCVAVIQVGTLFAAGSGTIEKSILAVLAGLVLSLLGGWFGGQLFPACVRRAGRRKYGPAPA